MGTGTEGNAVVPAAQLPSSQMFNFVELSCFTKDDSLRQQRNPVVFRLFSVGRALGAKVDVTFTNDYGLYYGGEDDYLVEVLSTVCPSVQWATGYTFFRWLDQSRIQVLSSTTGKIVAQLETRKYEGRRVRLESVAAGEYGPNVVTLDMLRVARVNRTLERLTAEREALSAEQPDTHADE